MDITPIDRRQRRAADDGVLQLARTVAATLLVDRVVGRPPRRVVAAAVVRP